LSKIKQEKGKVLSEIKYVLERNSSKEVVYLIYNIVSNQNAIYAILINNVGSSSPKRSFGKKEFEI